MNRPARRAILVVTPEELADALGIHPGAILDVRHNHQRDVTEVLITGPDLDEVAAMCEPPRVRLSRHPARRLRLAWLSARRRAAEATASLDAEFRGVDPDHVDPITAIQREAQAHAADLVLVASIRDRNRPTPIHTCAQYDHQTGRADFVHTTGPCTLDQPTPVAEPVEDTASHTRHTNDLREPSILLKTHPDGRPYFDQTRPWWLCHTTGLVHTEGPCILRTDPLDLRGGTGPIDLTDDVRATLFGAQARTR